MVTPMEIMRMDLACIQVSEVKKQSYHNVAWMGLWVRNKTLHITRRLPLTKCKTIGMFVRRFTRLGENVLAFIICWKHLLVFIKKLKNKGNRTVL